MKLVEAPHGWVAPSNATWALVRVSRDAHSPNDGLRFETPGTLIIQAADNPAAIAKAIDEAKLWACANGADIVYVKRHAPVDQA